VKSRASTEGLAEFHLTDLKTDNAGQYTCEYSRLGSPYISSQPSDVLLLLVTGEEVPRRDIGSCRDRCGGGTRGREGTRGDGETQNRMSWLSFIQGLLGKSSHSQSGKRVRPGICHFPHLAGTPARRTREGGGPRAAPHDLGALLFFQEIYQNLPSKPTQGVR